MEPLLLILLAVTAPARIDKTPLPPPPPPPVLEPLLPPDSVEARRNLARSLDAALKRVAGSRRDRMRFFEVGWEMHYGPYLVPAGSRNWLTAVRVTPDFVAEDVRDRFAAAADPNGPDMGEHTGRRLVCRCTGVEWSYNGERRFLIRTAQFTWKPADR